MINGNRRSRRGPERVPDPRQHCISVRLNDAELSQLDARRGELARGEWLRCSGLDRLPPVVPQPNIERWQVLANAANNLNQVARKLNSLVTIDEADQAELEFMRNALSEFRTALLGIRN
jgi:hypothetical protein